MSLRDNLLITAAMRAAYMHDRDEINLDTSVVGEDEITNFIVTAVADYIMTESHEPFDLYIEEVLKEEFGSTFTTEEAKKREEPPHKCSTCRYDNDIYTRECNRCDWGEKWKPKGSDS